MSNILRAMPFAQGTNQKGASVHFFGPLHSFIPHHSKSVSLNLSCIKLTVFIKQRLSLFAVTLRDDPYMHYVNIVCVCVCVD